MRVRHELCLDHDSTDPRASMDATEKLLVALGHGPDLMLKADRANGTVHGRVTVSFCDTRLLGVDVLGFRDGREEVATADNIEAWFAEQGHRLMKIDGKKAFGNTIVEVQITEAAEAPTLERLTTLARSTIAPSAEDVRVRIESFAASLAKSDFTPASIDAL